MSKNWGCWPVGPGMIEVPLLSLGVGVFRQIRNAVTTIAQQPDASVRLTVWIAEINGGFFAVLNVAPGTRKSNGLRDGQP